MEVGKVSKSIRTPTKFGGNIESAINGFRYRIKLNNDHIYHLITILKCVNILHQTTDDMFICSYANVVDCGKKSIKIITVPLKLTSDLSVSNPTIIIAISYIIYRQTKRIPRLNASCYEDI